MKKAVSIFAVVVMSLGMFSCTNDSSNDDSALYDVQDTTACDTCYTPKDGPRGGQ